MKKVSSRFNRKRVLALLTALCMLTLTACQKGGADPQASGRQTSPAAEVQPQSETETDAAKGTSKVVKIAALYNVTGSQADAGFQDINGCQLAIKHINDAGGIKSLGGAKLELVVGDTMSDVAQSKTVAERILDNPDIVAACGAGGSAFLMPMLPVIEKAKVPFMSINVSDAITQQGYKYVFQMYCKGSQFGGLQVDFVDYLNKNFNAKISKVGIIYENSEYGISTAKGCKDLATSAGLDVVFDESFPIGMSDASSMIVNLKNSGAQVIFPVCFSQDAKLIFNTMSSMNYSPIIVGGGAGFLFPAFAEELGTAVEGVVSTSMVNWDVKNVNEDANLNWVSKEYLKTYGEFAPEHAMASYNGIYIIANALEAAASTDKEVLCEAIRALDINTCAPGGKIAFGPEGWNNSAVPVMVQWQKDAEVGYITRTVFPLDQATAEFQLPAGIGG